MSRSQKPRKPYRPKWNSGGVKLRSEPWRVAAVFNPLESMLDAIERDDGFIAHLEAALLQFEAELQQMVAELERKSA